MLNFLNKPGNQASITRWVAGFFSVAGIALLALGSFGLVQLRELDHEIALTRSASASDELSKAMLSLQKTVQRQSDVLTTWDETRQQLLSPEYYGYWINSRVQRSGVLLDFFQSLNLYDRNGRPLPGAAAPALVTRPETNAGATLYMPGKGLRHIVHVAPVFTDMENHRTLLGYVQVEFDMIKLLKQSRSFSYLNPDSLKTSYSGPAATLNTLLPQLRFEITPPREFSALKAAVIKTYLAFALVILTASIIAYLAIQRRLAQPLADLAGAIDSLDADESQPRHSERLATPFKLQELDTVRQSVQEYRKKLSDARVELENRNTAFQRQALQDSLTGAHNRRAFDEDWENLVRGLEGRALPLAFLLFDCDHFKPINDTYGHHTGDKVLQTIADAVANVLRHEDKLYRIGGDEFAALLVNTDETTAMRIAERCLEAVQKQDFRQFGIIEPVGISIGIALGVVTSASDLTRMQARADAAMYRAKRPGSHKIALYREGDSEADDPLVATLETSALYHALANPEYIEMHFQRMQALLGNQVYYEALCRIRHQDTLLSPGRFMPVVQSRRLEADFDLAVLKRVHTIIESGLIPKGSGVSVNLSAQALVRPEIIAHLIELTRFISDHPLILEITETSLVPRLEEITYFLQMLRSDGFQIALDDFGSGYSPLRYLSELPVDIIKFDMSLVHQLQSGGRAGTVVSDFVRLMIDAGYTLIAEGIETEAQLEKVRLFGFNFAQGYLIDMPKPASSLLDMAEPEPDPVQEEIWRAVGEGG